MAVRKETGTKSAAKSPSKSAQGSRGKKKSSGETKKSSSWAVLFWLAFAIFIFGLFLFNRETISGSIQAVRNEMAARKTPEEDPPSETEEPAPPPARTAEPEITPRTQTREALPAAESPGPAQALEAAPDRTAPVVQQPRTERPEPAVQSPAAVQRQPSRPQNPPARRAELRERALYFIQVDRGGTILRIKVNRELPVSDSPMTDVILALINGPDTGEKQKGLISFIPPASRILSATVRGSTAYISFSEDFQYNTYGVEGYAGQLRQIVYTVTEFPNIADVQILIEGRRIDYLGEGVWIGSPVSREML